MQRHLVVLLLVMLGGCGGTTASNPQAAVANAAPNVISRSAPAGVRTDELVSYLHLEFGESPGDRNALKASDLSFVATLQFADRVEHVWRFPCVSETGCWLRVTKTPSQEWIGWSADPPPASLAPSS